MLLRRISRASAQRPVLRGLSWFPGYRAAAVQRLCTQPGAAAITQNLKAAPVCVRRFHLFWPPVQTCPQVVHRVGTAAACSRLDPCTKADPPSRCSLAPAVRHLRCWWRRWHRAQAFARLAQRLCLCLLGMPRHTSHAEVTASASFVSLPQLPPPPACRRGAAV